MQLALSFFSLNSLFRPSQIPAAYRQFHGTLMQLFGGIILALRQQLIKQPPDLMVVFLQTSIVIALLTCRLFRIRIPICCSDRILLSEEMKRRRFPRGNFFCCAGSIGGFSGYVAVSEEVWI